MENQNSAVVKPKVQKLKTPSKKARLIVRNLSFQVTEEKFRKHFSSCGDIKEINILKKPNGKLVGCAFIQYERVPQAAKAIRELNLKPFMSRPIAIDWALPKGQFQVKSEDEPPPETEVKEETDGLIPLDEIKEEPLDELEVKTEDDGILDNYEHLQQSLKRGRDSDGDDDEDQTESESDEESSKFNKEDSNKRRKVVNDDADEGRTVFIKNLEFETTPEKLKDFFGEFGPLCYAVLCKDKLTEHPKGTAFVKFKRYEDMDACLSKFQINPSHFTMGRRQFFVSEAMSKNKLDEKLQSSKKKEPKDRRNLFLAREGFIRPETEAATGLSLSDANKRTLLHRAKRQMLKNLNIFVSDVRLCIHNLPSQYSDKNLRKLFLKFGGKGAHLTEAKVMRDMNDLDINGVGRSKEFGFVTFTKHENALQALRAVNNNPGIFSPKKRPIVEFSLENRKALRAKEKRAEKSKEFNTNKKKLSSDSKDGSSTIENKKKKKERNRAVTEAGVEGSGTKKPYPKKYESHEELPKYSGLTAKFGVSTLPSLKAKGKITRKSLKPLKQKKKNQQERRMREPKSRPQVKAQREDQVDKLVSRYKQRSMSEQHKKVPSKKQKKKWFK